MISLKVTALALTYMITLFQSGTGYKVETRYPVPGNGGFDYIAIDSAARRLYVSHGTQVDVVNPDDGKLIGTIGDTPRRTRDGNRFGVQTWLHQQRPREQGLDV
jgi:hypothetical protein